MQLPPLGTNISYNYAIGAPALDVVYNAAPADVWQRDLTFADGRYLFVQFENVPPTPHGMEIELYLRGAGLQSLFEPLFLSFNEQLSLLTEGGAEIGVARNTGVGGPDNDPDSHICSWTIDPPDRDFSIHGLQWKITPDLLPGALLPTELDVQIGIFANGAIWVVPEPSGSTAMVVLVACPLFSSRSRLA